MCFRRIFLETSSSCSRESLPWDFLSVERNALVLPFAGDGLPRSACNVELVHILKREPLLRASRGKLQVDGLSRTGAAELPQELKGLSSLNGLSLPESDELGLVSAAVAAAGAAGFLEGEQLLERTC
ncbi:hypothetical protein Mapa_010118 [Marchantia paleacea]|nr:hypothetical protein Mapa_010118 [Marchantia paleacea]